MGNYRKTDRKSPRQTLEQILVKGSTFQTNKLRIRLIKAGIKKHQCECCKNTEWMGKPIPLELSHKNGINDDHRIENLEMLCPNCHAQTESYRGKNWGKASNTHHYFFNKTSGEVY